MTNEQQQSDDPMPEREPERSTEAIRLVEKLINEADDELARFYESGQHPPAAVVHRFRVMLSRVLDLLEEDHE